MSKKIIDCDLVVLGAGAAGMVAAVKAKNLGVKNVVVLEKAKKPGGCSWFAVGFNIENTKWQKEAGYPDTTDDLFRQRIKNHVWDVNHKIIRNFIDSSGPFFDWFDELCDINNFFSKPTPYVKPTAGKEGAAPQAMIMGPGSIRSTKRHMNEKSRDPSIGPGWAGSYIVSRMLEQGEKTGIQVITEARAREFIKDSKGNSDRGLG